MENNITGGVSPLKKRGGKHARAATATSRRRGGFSSSSSTKNPGGYNVNTRFSMDKWDPPASGGTLQVPVKPYSYDTKTGESVINQPTDIETGETNINRSTEGTPGYWTYKDVTNTEGLEAYKKVWDANKNDLQGKYEGDFDKWVGAAEKWWEDEAAKKDMSVEEFKQKYYKTTTKRVKDKWVPGTAGTSYSETSTYTKN